MLNVKSNVQSIIWGYGVKMYIANSDECCVMFKRNGQHVLEIWAAASQMSMSKWVQIRISEFDFDLHLYSLQRRWRCGDPQSSSGSLQQRKSFTNISQIYIFACFTNISHRRQDEWSLWCCRNRNPSKRMNDCFSESECDKLSETFRQGKDLSKVTFCVAIQSSFNLVNFKCVPRDISRSFKSCFGSQRWSFLGVETSPVWEKMDWSGIMTWSSTRDNAPDPILIMDYWLLSVAQVSRCPPK